MTLLPLTATLAVTTGTYCCPFREGSTMFRFEARHLVFVLGLVAPMPAFAATFCVAVNGGFGNGGTSYVAPDFALPVSGLCKPWAGFTKDATTVIATASGTGCLSSNGKVLTLAIFNTDPAAFGSHNFVSDYVRICPKSAGTCPISGSDDGNYSGTAAEQTCTAALLRVPVFHD
jgi:hypothetical protein